MDRYQPVRDAAPVCSANGCLWQTAAHVREAAAMILEERSRLLQYDGVLALWCVRGAHAFSEADPGRVIVPAASGRDDAGNEVIIPAQAICGYCMRRQLAPRTRPQELEEAPSRYDPVLTRLLEEENEQLRREAEGHGP